MMPILLMLFAFGAGVLQPIQAAVNSNLAQRGATVLWASAISAAVSAVALAICAVVIWRVPPPPLSLVGSIPRFLWTGGIIGAIIVGMMTTVAPRLGASRMFICFLIGIMACSFVLDQLGALGLPQQSPSFGRAIAGMLLVAAAVLVRFF